MPLRPHQGLRPGQQLYVCQLSEGLGRECGHGSGKGRKPLTPRGKGTVGSDACPNFPQQTHSADGPRDSLKVPQLEVVGVLGGPGCSDFKPVSWEEFSLFPSSLFGNISSRHDGTRSQRPLGREGRVLSVPDQACSGLRPGRTLCPGARRCLVQMGVCGWGRRRHSYSQMEPECWTRRVSPLSGLRGHQEPPGQEQHLRGRELGTGLQ